MVEALDALESFAGTLLFPVGNCEQVIGFGWEKSGY